ncbi:MAG: PKD domain-containing protein, partial [Candidatus Aenigmarchaeota archaeon]|nr:PKD domain-containing protein [Candidatus Aenigmarchaeota archaeon]
SATAVCSPATCTAACTYSTPGIYLPAASFSSTWCNTWVLVKPLAENHAPLANFTAAPTNAYVNESISFDAAASSDPDGQELSFYWDFGDGTTAAGVRAGHEYRSPGLYAARLTATDALGANGTYSKPINVSYRPVLPYCTLLLNQTTIYINESVRINVSYGNVNATGSLAISCGNGTYANATGCETLSCSSACTYGAAGFYTASANLTSIACGFGFAVVARPNTTIGNLSITGNRIPTLDFSFTPSSPFEADEITFTASATDADGFIASYAWDFGDGSTASGRTARHAYTNAGRYKVAVAVTDDKGAVARAEKLVQARLRLQATNKKPVAAFTMSPAAPQVGTDITFNAAGSSDPEGPLTSYAWDFGDGSTASGKTAKHSYASGGLYSVTLEVTDGAGDTDAATKGLEVLEVQEVAVSPLYIAAGVLVAVLTVAVVKLVMARGA